MKVKNTFRLLTCHAKRPSLAQFTEIDVGGTIRAQWNMCERDVEPLAAQSLLTNVFLAANLLDKLVMRHFPREKIRVSFKKCFLCSHLGKSGFRVLSSMKGALWMSVF